MATERRDCNATRYEPMLVASRPVASRRIVGQLAVPQTTVGKLASRLLMGGVLLGGAGFGSLAIAQQTASAYPSSTAQATESLADASPLFVSQSSEGPAQTLAQMPTAPLPGSNMAAVNLNSYILGSGDQVTLSVVGYPEFTGTLAVLPDGSVTLPLVGAVRAAGLTPSQLSQG